MHSLSSESPKVDVKELEKPPVLVDQWLAALAREKSRNYPANAVPLRTSVLTFARLYLSGQMKRKSSISLMIRDCIAGIQARIGEQLDEILHDSQFQAMEARWRGLYFFITSSQSLPEIRIRIFAISKSELLKDFERAVQFDRSALFKQVYEKEFGTFGGTPYSFLIGDFEFSRSARDLTLLQNISKIASAAHAPFISGVHPGLMDMSTFSELGSFRQLSRLFESKELIKWHAFRDSEDSRYVVLVLPRILLRLPYGKLKGRLNPGAIQYEEIMNGSNSENYLWGNAAFALGQRICKSFERFGWMAKFLGVDESGAGIVTGLPVPTFDTLPLPKMSTSVFILSAVEKELSYQGLVSLSHCKMTSYAAFFSAQTVHRQKKYMKAVTNANERLSSMLPYLLTASRFAHYLKAIMRDKIGKFSNRTEIEKYLNNWISQYVLTQTNVSTDLKSLHPLQESRITVFDDSARPGHYKMLSHIRPHYQLEALNASIRLVSNVPTLIN
jgi:type VI secretion system protein ImpC